MTNKELFDTPEKIGTAVANFKTLKATAGWQLVVEIIRANMEVLEDQILNGINVEGFDETKEMIDRKRDKLKAYREVIETPDYWITRLETVVLPQENDDPFDTVESLNKGKKGN